MSTTDTVTYDPMSPGHMDDPCPAHRRLRDEHPVYYSERHDLWVISRFDDVTAAARDFETFSSTTPIGAKSAPCAEAIEILGRGRVKPPLPDTLQTLDPPAHRANRRIVNQVFNARRIAGLEDFVRRTVLDLAKSFVPRGSVEIIEELAVPLPMRVITHLLGFPPEDMPQLKRWSDAIAGGLSPDLSDEEQIEGALATTGWFDRVADEIEDRRRSPRGDFLSDLATADRPDAGPLSLAEAVGIATQAMVAGNETTTGLLGGAFVALAERPELRAQLVAEPSLIATFVEEALRTVSPVQGLYRITTRDVGIRGTVIPAGSRVQLLWGAANTDPAEFPDPHRIDLHRERAWHHLAFGHGPHLCPGAAVSRQEARVALEILLPSMEGLRPAAGWKPSWKKHFHLRGPLDVRLEFEPTADIGSYRSDEYAVVHPLSHKRYSLAPDGSVVIDSAEGTGRFTRDGEWIEGTVRTADPQMCRWIASRALIDQATRRD